MQGGGGLRLWGSWPVSSSAHLPGCLSRYLGMVFFWKELLMVWVGSATLVPHLGGQPITLTWRGERLPFPAHLLLPS